MSTDQPLSILILGASYGILPATKLALAGHRVTVVGRPAEIATMAVTGIELRVPARETGDLLHLRLYAVAERAAGAGQLTLRSPQTADPDACDLNIATYITPHN